MEATVTLHETLSTASIRTEIVWRSIRMENR